MKLYHRIQKFANTLHMYNNKVWWVFFYIGYVSHTFIIQLFSLFFIKFMFVPFKISHAGVLVLYDSHMIAFCVNFSGNPKMQTKYRK